MHKIFTVYLFFIYALLFMAPFSYAEGSNNSAEESNNSGKDEPVKPKSDADNSELETSIKPATKKQLEKKKKEYEEKENKRKEKEREERRTKPRPVEEERITQRPWLYSLCLPGFGQIRNKDYWKVPVFYGGFAALGIAALVYNHEYYELINKDLFPKGCTTALAARRNRDVFIIFIGIWYIINVLDAYASASLKTFDLSPNIKAEIKPEIQLPKSPDEPPRVGVSLSLSKK